MGKITYYCPGCSYFSKKLAEVNMHIAGVYLHQQNPQKCALPNCDQCKVPRGRHDELKSDRYPQKILSDNVWAAVHNNPVQDIRSLAYHMHPLTQRTNERPRSRSRSRSPLRLRSRVRRSRSRSRSRSRGKRFVGGDSQIMSADSRSATDIIADLKTKLELYEHDKKQADDFCTQLNDEKQSLESIVAQLNEKIQNLHRIDQERLMTVSSLQSEILQISCSMERALQESLAAYQRAQAAEDKLAECERNKEQSIKSFDAAKKEFAALQTDFSRVQYELRAERDNQEKYRRQKAEDRKELQKFKAHAKKYEDYAAKLVSANRLLKDNIAQLQGHQREEAEKTAEAEKKAELAEKKRQAVLQQMEAYKQAKEELQVDTEAAEKVFVKPEQTADTPHPKSTEEKEQMFRRKQAIKMKKQQVRDMQKELQDMGLCPCCYERRVEVATTRCGHVLCQVCSMQIHDKCYECRAQFRSDRCDCGYFFMPLDTECKTCKKKRRGTAKEWQCSKNHVNLLDNELPLSNHCTKCKELYVPFELRLPGYHRVDWPVDHTFDLGALLPKPDVDLTVFD